MKKIEIKLSLIDDYIKICQIKNFSNNSFENFMLSSQNKLKLNKINNLSCLLEKIYIILFDELKLNNLSFDILQKELEQNNSLFLNTNLKNIDIVLGSSLLTLQKNFSNLKTKIGKLKINLSFKNLFKYDFIR